MHRVLSSGYFVFSDIYLMLLIACLLQQEQEDFHDADLYDDVITAPSNENTTEEVISAVS